jgi:peptidoglycan/xylan/chitin deacetylase (PgdA/CDA1 family)
MVSLSFMRSAVLAALLMWRTDTPVCPDRQDCLSSTSEVAITFDDLPAPPAAAPRLLKAIVRAHVPAVGFVNENKLATKAHIDVLQRWHAAGLELGNHTYSHRDLHTIGAEEFTRDVVRGEPVTRTILGRAPRWFRHPFLHTGTSMAMKQEVEEFLTQRGYRIAPVTLDNSEWIFAAAYEKAKDAATRKRIGEAYLVYMDRKLGYFEEQSQKLFGRNIRHVLLVHANTLNADWFDELAASMRRRGYRFIPLERALEDPAYRSADTYAGPSGITWIHRWALTAGKKGAFFAGEPATPQWIQDVAGIRE